MATMQKITPFLWFEDKAEEAMAFYTSIFPDSKIVSTKYYPKGITEGPMAGFDGKVLTGVFELMGQRFMCLDGDPKAQQCGWCKDKYGFSWQIVPDMNQWLGDESEGAQRATQAMLGMKKIIIADLQKAYDGE